MTVTDRERPIAAVGRTRFSDPVLFRQLAESRTLSTEPPRGEENLWSLERLRAARDRAYDAAIDRSRSRIEAGAIHDDRAADEVLVVELDRAEVIFLRRALLSIWGGSVHMKDEVAALLGYEDATAFAQDQERLVGCAGGTSPVARRDWRRLLTSSELAFASYELGGAWDWGIVTGIGDEASILILRALQSKLGSI